MLYVPDALFKNDMLRDEKKLEPLLEAGDVLVSIDPLHPKSKFHKRLRAGQTFGMIFKGTGRGRGFVGASHAALYLGDGKVTEAVYDGVRRATFHEYLESFGMDRINVYRCKDANLAKAAAKIGRQWSGGLTRLMTDKENEIYGKTAFSKALMKKSVFYSASFNKTARLRAIKYSARRELPSPLAKGGVFCSMFVTACYQAAGLMAVVETLDPDDHQAKTNFKESHIKKYWNGPTRYWKYDYKAALTKAFYVNSRYTTPRLLTGLFGVDKTNWIYCGYFFPFDTLRNLEEYLSKKEIAELVHSHQIRKSSGGLLGLKDYDYQDLKTFADRDIWFDEKKYVQGYQDMWDKIIVAPFANRVRPMSEIMKWKEKMETNLPGMKYDLNFVGSRM